MEYKKYAYPTHNLHIIKTDKFKECRIEISFRENITRDKFLKCMLLFELLAYSNNKFQKHRDLVVRSEELYRTQLHVSTSKLGGQIMSSIICSFINPKYIENNEYVENVIEYLCTFIFNPNIHEEQFDETSLNVIKNYFISGVETIIENPTRVAILNACNLFPEDSNAKIFCDNYTKSDVENITSHDLYEMYLEVINHFVCDVIVVGDLNFNKIDKLLSKYLKFKTVKNHKLNLYVNENIKMKLIKKREISRFSQSTILLLFNLLNLTEKERLYTIVVFDFIFCNGSFKSMLFKSLREDNSLCYGVSSLYIKFENLYGIKVSLAKENIDKAIDLIKKALKKMTLGKFDDSLLDEAKKSMITQIKSKSDKIGSYGNQCLLNEIDIFPSAEDRIKAYQSLEKSEIIEISKKLKLLIDYGLENEA